MAVNARLAAVKLLNSFYQEQGYSNIVLNEYLTRTPLEPQDKTFLTALFYGVIERRLTLDYLISDCSSKSLTKLHPAVLQILRTAVYQLVYMDRIPPSAAVNEAVKLVRRFRQNYAAGFVNAVLRKVHTSWQTLLDELPAGMLGDSVRYSCPTELISFFRETMGDELSGQIVAHLNDVPTNYLRLNTLSCFDKKLAELTEYFDENYKSYPNVFGCYAENNRLLQNSLAHLPENCYYHQDAASQVCCLALGAQPGETVADVCAAPGGKSFTIAQSMGNRGRLVSTDLYAHKCDKISRRAKALGVSILEARVRDASKPCNAEEVQAYDRVLCDVPCSGLGVIQRKPEIRYKSVDQIRKLPELQLKILQESSCMVKPGGVLQYSTCTINPYENEKVAEAFLAANPDFKPRRLPIDAFCAGFGVQPDWHITLYPHVHGTDGFFIAGFSREVHA